MTMIIRSIKKVLSKPLSGIFSISRILKNRTWENNSLYLDLVKNSLVGLYQTTPEGQIIYANQAILKMLKYDSLKDLSKKDLSKECYVDNNKREIFKKVLKEKGEIINFQSEWYTKDGGIIYVREGARAVRDAKGRIFRYDGYVDNITDFKLTQMKLIKATQEAEEASKLKSAFLTNMNHEIRTPMNSILGFSELLEDSVLSKEDHLKYIDAIQQSSIRMLNTIDELIQMSKLDSNCLDIYIEDVNVKDVIEDIYVLYKPEANAKGIEFSFEKNHESKEIIIFSDKEKIQVILSKLISNAIKYTNQGSVEFGFNFKTKTNEIQFYIKDTGIGISRDNHELIFEHFYRIDNGKELIYEGSGLGLTIVKEYVRILGGKIRVESVKGEGSQFYFILPIN
ncbi:PAS domain-containing sensor histidine kinase [Labilibaculum sp.]|uniref:PAS domain-containing sensor histidine kinase n=1 Tax=Labilibaculum sp. TaxID=2060723 RepID=UPI002AA7EDC1|nr:PAS domain-containing sensor histidine kinase [Labilibaculum sp.]